MQNYFLPWGPNTFDLLLNNYKIQNPSFRQCLVKGEN